MCMQFTLVLLMPYSFHLFAFRDRVLLCSLYTLPALASWVQQLQVFRTILLYVSLICIIKEDIWGLANWLSH